MLILIKNKAIISGVDNSTLAGIKKFLTIDNPLFNQRIEMGLANWGVPSQLKYYEYDPKLSSQIIAPVGSLPDLIASGLISPTEEELIDKRVEGSAASEFFSKLNFTGTLRDYQEEIVIACMSKSIGVVEAMTGSGKTASFVNLVVKRKVPTLVLVNTIELANQTIEAFVKFTTANAEDIGFIGSGEFKPSPIAVCLHQTMSNLNDAQYELLNRNYGMVIADEVHIIAARTYYETMSRLEMKYKYGFSATPKRDDGLTAVIHFATGPKIHTVPKEALAQHLIKPSVRYEATKFRYFLLSQSQYQEMISDLAINKERNEQIVDLLNTEFSNNYVILLCTRVEQVNKLVEMIGPSAVALTSKTKKKERVQALKDLHSKAKQHVVSTYGLFSTGIDVPHMDTLFLCSPIKSEIKVRQSAGRLMRKADGKTSATIVDFVDGEVELLKYQSYKRRRILKNL